MSELPKGWEITQLAEVCRIVRGVTYNKAQASDAPEPGYIPVLRANNIQPPALVHEDLVYVPESCVSPDQMIAAGDIVIAMSSGSRSVVGKAAQSVNQWTGSFGAFCGVLRPVSDVHAGFIGHFCRSKAYRDKTTELAAGVNINNLKPSNFSEIDIPVPPLAEQARIAQALDGLLAQVDTLKARLDALPALIKRFRQSVLAAAVSGKLTEDWRLQQPPATTASKAVPDTQVEKWAWEEVPDAWETCFYEDAFQSRLGKMLDKAKNTGNETPYLGNINVRWFSFDTSNTQKIRVSDQEAVELTLMKGDVLICEGGEPGRCAVWNVQNGQYIYQKALHRARAIKSVLPEWLTYNLKNDADNTKLSMLFTGTTIKHLTGRSLATYPIRLPPLIEQEEIVRRVEQLFAFADQLETRLSDARKQVDNLTQSILAKAFRGELVPQDPSDEPASALLARISAQRAAAPKPKRGRKAAASKA